MVTPSGISGFLLDTGLFIAAERGDFNLEGFISRTSGLSGVAFSVSSITAAELLVGVEYAESSARKRNKSGVIEAYLSTFAVMEFDLPCARRWAQLAAHMQKRGQLIGAHDLLIAATALHHGYGVVTFNTKAFMRVPGLVVVSPSSDE